MLDDATKIRIEERCYNELEVQVQVWTDNMLILAPCRLEQLEGVVKVIKEEIGDAPTKELVI